MDEPIIVVNGVTLTREQAMAVRVAVSTMLSEMYGPDALGDDDVGRDIAKGYKNSLTEVERLMLSGISPGGQGI